MSEESIARRREDLQPLGIGRHDHLRREGYDLLEADHDQARVGTCRRVEVSDVEDSGEEA